MIAHHGLVTWGNDPIEAYSRTIDLVGKASDFLVKKRKRTILRAGDFNAVQEKYTMLAPVIRGILSTPSNDPDNPFHHVILKPIRDKETCALLASPDGKAIVMTTPLTPDYLIRTRTVPLWLDSPSLDNQDSFRTQLSNAVSAYNQEYQTYIQRAAGGSLTTDDTAFYPRIICIPGLGIVCAVLMRVRQTWSVTLRSMRFPQKNVSTKLAERIKA